MNKKQAQVFIATTKGLVQVKSIARLSDEDISSVATVAGTSTLAGISASYQAFVEKPQGLIVSLFGGYGYRINLSGGIDQGESWQLGAFLAHYLFEYDCLKEPDAQTSEYALGDEDASNDIIFVVTGRVDTINTKVLPITALAKKCLLANSAVKHWQAQGKRVCFLVPSENFREPTPDTVVQLTPVNTLEDISQLCRVFDLPVAPRDFFNEVLSPTTNNNQHQGVTIEADRLPNTPFENVFESPSNGSNETVVPNNAKIYISRKTRKVILGFICIVAGIYFYINENTVSGSANNEIASGHNDSIKYALVGDLSENKMNCGAAQSAILDEGQLTRYDSAVPANIEHLCNMSLWTNNRVASIWLVSDTKAIFPLKPMVYNVEQDKQLRKSEVINEQATRQQWLLPLPTNQTQTRKYTLLIFDTPSDAADVSSLDSYLLQLQQIGKQHSIEDLQKWVNRTQQGKDVRMLSHELTRN